MKTIELTRSMDKVFKAMRDVHKHLVEVNKYADQLERWYEMRDLGLLDTDMQKPTRPDRYPPINF